jgi:hypothetical protein
MIENHIWSSVWSAIYTSAWWIYFLKYPDNNIFLSIMWFIAGAWLIILFWGAERAEYFCGHRHGSRALVNKANRSRPCWVGQRPAFKERRGE